MTAGAIVALCATVRRLLDEDELGGGGGDRERAVRLAGPGHRARARAVRRVVRRRHHGQRRGPAGGRRGRRHAQGERGGVLPKKSLIVTHGRRQAVGRPLGEPAHARDRVVVRAERRGVGHRDGVGGGAARGHRVGRLGRHRHGRRRRRCERRSRPGWRSGSRARRPWPSASACRRRCRGRVKLAELVPAAIVSGEVGAKVPSVDEVERATGSRRPGRGRGCRTGPRPGP